jgi:hypothetical protein
LLGLLKKLELWRVADSGQLNFSIEGGEAPFDNREKNSKRIWL